MNDRLRLILAMTGLGIVAFFAGVAISDIATDDANVLLPEPAQYHPVSNPDDGTDTSGSDEDPGAVIGIVDIPAPDQLFDEANPVYPTTYDEDGTPTPDLPPSMSSNSGGSSTTTTQGPATTTTQGPATTTTQGPATTTTQGPATTTTQGPATTTTQGPATPGAAGPNVAVARFTDLCAQTPTSGCPPGIGALVLYGADVTPPPLDIVIVPDVDASVVAGLRCDPGWPSSTQIPVVILSNQPLSLLHVTLKSSDGAELDAVVNTKSEPVEHTRYQARAKNGEPVRATLKEGAHTCVNLKTDARGDSVDRNGSFEVFVQGYTAEDYEAKTARFTGHYTSQRPPVRILPLDAHRAYVVVYQRSTDSVKVWANDENDVGNGKATPSGCSQPPPDLTGSLALPRSPGKGPTLVATDQPGYPWDRDFDRQTIWDLELRDATRYTLCVRWSPDGTTEEWSLETPNDLQLDVYGGALRHTKTAVKGTLLVHLLGVGHCFVANPDLYQSDGPRPFPNETVYGDGTYPYGQNADMCHSGGWRIGPTIELRALFADGTNKIYGTINVPTATLAAMCRVGTDNSVPTAQPCEQRLEWRNQNILCGGGLFTPSCKGDLWFSLGVKMRMTDGRTNNRSDPRDWGITQIARAADPPDTVPLPSG